MIANSKTSLKTFTKKQSTEATRTANTQKSSTTFLKHSPDMCQVYKKSMEIFEMDDADPENPTERIDVEEKSGQPNLSVKSVPELNIMNDSLQDEVRKIENDIQEEIKENEKIIQLKTQKSAILIQARWRGYQVRKSKIG